jgi:hypothetical protein
MNRNTRTLIAQRDIEIVIAHLSRSGVSRGKSIYLLELLQGQRNPRKSIFDTISSIFKKYPTVRVGNKMLEIGIHASWDSMIDSYGKTHWNPFNPEQNPDEYFTFLVYAYHRKTGRAFMYDHTTQSTGADRIIERLEAVAN